MKKLLYFLIGVLLVIVGVGVTLTSNMQHGDMQHGNFNLSSLFGKPKAMQDMEVTPKTDQKVTVVLEPDLRKYIDEINKGISLINEANGLVTADPFFANPPKLTDGRKTTPFDQTQPNNQTNPAVPNNQIILLPDGTYRIVGESGLNMTNIHRGIYKLGQGMTLLNTVLDRMNEDIKNNNFPVKTPMVSSMYSQNGGMATNQDITGGGHAGMTNMPGMSVQGENMAGMNMPGLSQTMTQSTPMSSLGTLSYLLIFAVIGFVILAVVSLFGFISSIFRRPRVEH